MKLLRYIVLFIAIIITTNSFAIPEAHLEESLKQTEISIGDTSQEIRALNQQLKNERNNLTQLEKKQQQLSQNLAKQQAILATQLRVIYQARTSPTVKILLTQKKIQTIHRQLTYYRYLSQNRLSLIRGMKKDLQAIEVNKKTLISHQQNLQHLLMQKELQQHQLQAMQTSRKKLLTEMRQNISKPSDNQNHLQPLFHDFQTQPLRISNLPFRNTRGKLAWPVRGRLLANYGSNLDRQRLSGVIIKTPEGAPVRAIYQGKVIFANWLRGFGLLIIINHGDGYMSLYARNQSLMAKPGMSVKQGDLIATTGSSGGYEKPSLYFEIRRNGNPVNPATWCN